MKWNEVLFGEIVENIFGWPAGDKYPWYATVVRWILRPIDSFRWYMKRRTPS